MPSAVTAAATAKTSDEPPVEEEAASVIDNHDDVDDAQQSDNDDMDIDGGGGGMFQPEDTVDFSHLADGYKEPLFVYPSSDPSTKMKAAYASQKTARQQYDAARKQREEMELTMVEKLGKLHNLLRESKERENKVKRTLRKKTLQVYETELQESSDKHEFNEWMGKLKAFVKKYKGLPPSLEEMEEQDTIADYEEEAKLLAQWVHDQRTMTHPPHHLAALIHIGVTFPPSEENDWHRSLHQFQLYAKDYWDNPILVQSTNGDVQRSIMEYTTDNERKALQLWCQTQQKQYQQDGLQNHPGHYTKLVDAGFTFDIIVDDEQWKENIESVLQFRTKFGHVHIPEDYCPPDSLPPNQGPKLKEFTDNISTLVHRDALSPKRLKHLKLVNLYLELGGRVYDSHVRYCKAGREERGEKQRTKRKFEALAMMAMKEMTTVKKKPVVPRGSMDNWNAKLEKLVAYKNKNGDITNIQNDVKLRGWTFSIIRKLSINSSSFRGNKMKLIESHEGLKEYLLQPEHVEAAVAEHKARKEELAAEKNGGDGEDKEEEEEGESKEDELEELTEDVLLGKTEDDELIAFMESKEEIV